MLQNANKNGKNGRSNNVGNTGRSNSDASGRSGVTNKVDRLTSCSPMLGEEVANTVANATTANNGNANSAAVEVIFPNPIKGEYLI